MMNSHGSKSPGTSRYAGSISAPKTAFFQRKAVPPGVLTPPPSNVSFARTVSEPTIDFISDGISPVSPKDTMDRRSFSIGNAGPSELTPVKTETEISYIAGPDFDPWQKPRPKSISRLSFGKSSFYSSKKKRLSNVFSRLKSDSASESNIRPPDFGHMRTNSEPPLTHAPPAQEAALAHGPGDGATSFFRPESTFSGKTSRTGGRTRSMFEKVGQVTSAQVGNLQSNFRSLAEQQNSKAKRAVSALFQIEKKPKDVDSMEEKGKNLSTILGGALGACDVISKFVETHNEKIGEDRQIQSISAQNDRIVSQQHRMFTTIALYGDTGAGKSSLINALLDHECITPTSNDASGTATAIEFRTPEHNMRAKYTVKVDFLTDTEWVPLAEKYLRDLNSNDGIRVEDDDNGYSGFDSDLYAARAEEVLESLFDLADENEPITLDMVRNLPIAEYLNKPFATENLVELQKYVKVLNGRFWPVVKRIKVYIDSPLLNTGVVLVDLPGLKDFNPAKEAVMTQYLKKCDKIFIVANIARAFNNINEHLSNGRLKSVIQQVELDSFSKISMVLTQTDNIQRDISNQKWKKKEAALERNEATEQQIRKGLKKTEIFKTKIFCVSSLEYQWQHKRLRDKSISPCMTKADSGIPDLRKYIQLEGLKLREDVVENLVRGDMMELLKSIRVLNVGGDEREVKNEYEHVEKKAKPPNFEEFRESLHCVINEKGWVPLRKTLNHFKKKIDEEIKPAAEEAEKIPAYWHTSVPHYSTFTAICKNHGRFEDSKKVLRDWNEELAQPLMDVLASHWGSFNVDFAKSEIAEIFRNVKASLNCMISAFLYATIGAKHNVVSILIQVDRLIESQVTTGWREELKEINRIITKENPSTIKQKMLPHYKACRKEGEGTKERRRQYILENVSGKLDMLSHYQSLCSKISLKLLELIACSEENVRNELDLILTAIENNYFHKEDPEEVEKEKLKGEQNRRDREEVCRIKSLLVGQVEGPLMRLEFLVGQSTMELYKNFSGGRPDLRSRKLRKSYS